MSMSERHTEGVRDGSRRAIRQSPAPRSRYARTPLWALLPESHWAPCVLHVLYYDRVPSVRIRPQDTTQERFNYLFKVPIAQVPNK